MAWHPTYYALQLNDPENETVVLVPSFGVFTDSDTAQGEANAYNKSCGGKIHYTVVPVQILPMQENANA